MAGKLLFDRLEKRKQRVPRDVLEALALAQGKVALKMAPEPGYQTLVREDGEQAQPTAPDRTPESVLPLPGSATPGGEGRDIGKFEFNTPNNDIDLRPRTLPEEGENRGHPVNDNLSSFSRRTMTSASRPEFVWEGDDFEGDPWKLAKSVGVNILSNKDFRAGYTVDGEIIAALFDASDSDGYEFDIAVRKDWQRKGLGAKLMDVAFGNFEENRDAYGDDYTLNLDVISPVAALMLRKRGLVEVGREGGHILMTKRAGVSGSPKNEEEEPLNRVASAWKQRWTPGKRQRKQRGKQRMKSRQYYRMNKSKLRRKQKIRRSRSSWKKSPARKRSEGRRQRQNRHRVGSVQGPACSACVAERWLQARMEPARERGGVEGGPQRRQKYNEKRKEQKDYSGKASRRKRDSLRWYHRKCKPNPNCRKRRKEYNEDPSYYERRAPKQASVLTVPDIAFVIGPDMVLGYVDTISPMTGMVNFRIDASHVYQMGSLPVEIFLRAATLLSEEDLTAFLELVDVEVGLEAYEDLDAEGLQECAGLYGIDSKSEAFKAQCFELVGETDPDAMNAIQLDLVNDHLVLGVLEGGGEPRDSEDADDHDETIPDTYDPHLFYGEVEDSKTEDG